MSATTIKMKSRMLELGLALLLAAAGPALGAADDCLGLTAENVELLSKYLHPNSFLRYCISQSQWAVKKGDVLEYEIFIPKQNPEKNGGIDLLGEDEKTRLGACKAVDQNGAAADPAATLDAAVDKWYARQIPLDQLEGKTIRQAALVIEGELPGVYALFVDNVRIRHADQTVTVLYENGPAPRFGIRKFKFQTGTKSSEEIVEVEEGIGPYGPLFRRSGYAGYPALLAVSRAGGKTGQAAEGFLQQGREQSRRQQRAQKLALECHFLKTWIERDKSLGLDKELTELSDRVNKLFDPGLSGEAFESGVKALEPALAGLSLTAAARARQAQPPKGKPVLLVDFGKEMGPVTYRASGFLHALNGDEPKDAWFAKLKEFMKTRKVSLNTWNEPPDAVVAPLKPQSLRMRPFGYVDGFAAYDRSKRLGIKHVSVIISAIVHDKKAFEPLPYPGENNDWSSWEATVREMVQRALDNKYRIAWDIWNEPNGAGYFPGSDHKGPLTDRFKETWKRAVTIIRSMDPKAVIVGPSTSGFARPALEDFLLFARDQKVLPDWLSWHDYKGGAMIVKNTGIIRDFMKANNIPELPICINEYCDLGEQFYPGVQVDYFAGLERVGVISANRACWDDDNSMNGSNLTLDGILTHPEREPRSVWWAYKGYADITGTLVDVTANDQKFSAVAGYDAARRQAIAIIGQVHRVAVPDAPVVVRFAGLDKAAGLVKNNKVRVTGAWIPNSETKALLRPLATLDGEYEVKDNAITVVIPNMGRMDAYQLTLGGTEEQK